MERERPRSPDAQFARALARAFGGAIIFGLPILMTMEMWELGAAMSRIRLAIFLLVSIPLLIGLSAVSGFERTIRLKHDALDAFVALAVAAGAAVVVLAVLGVLGPGQSIEERVGLVTLQAIPGSIGALLAGSQFTTGPGDDDPVNDGRHEGYAWEMFLMAAGALFLAFNIAPTDEVPLLAARMSPWHTAAAALLSLVLMHAFVYAVEFSGQATPAPGTPLASVFLRYTVAGYALVLAISAYILWTFGRTAGLAPAELVAMIVVLAIPGSIGAAAARLVL